MADWTLEDLLKRGESKDLDFKAASKWDPKSDRKACCELVKDILAMANTNGGMLVVGVSELATGFDPTGLSQHQLSTWDSTKLNQFLRNYASTPINATIVIVEYQGNHFVVIEIPRFSAMPHLCVRDYPDVLRSPALYVRTDSNESAEVSSHHDLAAIVNSAVKNRSDEMLRDFKILMEGSHGQPDPSSAKAFAMQMAEAEAWFADQYAEQISAGTGYLRATICPSNFTEKRFSFEELRRAAASARFVYGDYAGLLFDGNTGPTNRSNCIEFSFDWGGGYSGRFEGWRLYRSGLFFSRQVIADDVNLGHRSPYATHQPGALIDIQRLGAFPAIAVDTANSIYSELGLVDEDFTVRIDLIGAENRRLSVPATWTLISTGLVSREPSITAELTLSAQEWIAGKVQHSLALANELMAMFNLRTSYRQDKIEEVFARRRR